MRAILSGGRGCTRSTIKFQGIYDLSTDVALSLGIFLYALVTRILMVALNSAVLWFLDVGHLVVLGDFEFGGRVCGWDPFGLRPCFLGGGVISVRSIFQGSADSGGMVIEVDM